MFAIINSFRTRVLYSNYYRFVKRLRYYAIIASYHFNYRWLRLKNVCVICEAFSVRSQRDATRVCC